MLVLSITVSVLDMIPSLFIACLCLSLVMPVFSYAIHVAHVYSFAMLCKKEVNASLASKELPLLLMSQAGILCIISTVIDGGIDVVVFSFLVMHLVPHV